MYVCAVSALCTSLRKLFRPNLLTPFPYFLGVQRGDGAVQIKGGVFKFGNRANDKFDVKRENLIDE